MSIAPGQPVSRTISVLITACCFVDLVDQLLLWVVNVPYLVLFVNSFELLVSSVHGGFLECFFYLFHAWVGWTFDI